MEVAHSDQTPARWQCGTICAPNEGVIAQIPDGRLTRAGVGQGVIGFPILIEIAYRDQAPARRKGGPICGTNVNIVVQVPDRGLKCSAVIQRVIRSAIAIWYLNNN